MIEAKGMSSQELILSPFLTCLLPLTRVPVSRLLVSPSPSAPSLFRLPSYCLSRRSLLKHCPHPCSLALTLGHSCSPWRPHIRPRTPHSSSHPTFALTLTLTVSRTHRSTPSISPTPQHRPLPLPTPR